MSDQGFKFKPSHQIELQPQLAVMQSLREGGMTVSRTMEVDEFDVATLVIHLAPNVRPEAIDLGRAREVFDKVIVFPSE